MKPSFKTTIKQVPYVSPHHDHVFLPCISFVFELHDIYSILCLIPKSPKGTVNDVSTLYARKLASQARGRMTMTNLRIVYGLIDRFTQGAGVVRENARHILV